MSQFLASLVSGALLLTCTGCTPASNEPLAQNQNPANAEYRVDPSDFLDAKALLATAQAADSLTDAEKDGLLLMREEEKLARDVYQKLYEIWGKRIFDNISKSEQTHTTAIAALLDRYDIADPVTDDTAGVFTNETLQNLYNDLVAQGSVSLEAALTVGATVEDLDIKDLQDLLAQTDKPDITTVYKNLMRGSRNHLRAFYRQLGGEYEAQYITAEELEQIVNSPQERGGGHEGRGNGGGQGQGGGRGQGGGQGGGGRGWR
jgi:hypothetical protein